MYTAQVLLGPGCPKKAGIFAWKTTTFSSRPHLPGPFLPEPVDSTSCDCAGDPAPRATPASPACATSALTWIRTRRCTPAFPGCCTTQRGMMHFRFFVGNPPAARLSIHTDDCACQIPYLAFASFASNSRGCVRSPPSADFSGQSRCLDSEMQIEVFDLDSRLMLISYVLDISLACAGPHSHLPASPFATRRSSLTSTHSSSGAREAPHGRPQSLLPPLR